MANYIGISGSVIMTDPEKFPLLFNREHVEHIEIGDYLLATGEETISYIKKWAKYIKVVHLHNVEFQHNKYIWVPVHSSHELDETHFKVENIISKLAKENEVFFVFEHTPHSNPKETFVKEGIQWVKELIEEEKKV